MYITKYLRKHLILHNEYSTRFYYKKIKLLFKKNLQEFENAIEENSYLLTDMAIRFTKICGFYDPGTNEWWSMMKKIFQRKCIVSANILICY